MSETILFLSKHDEWSQRAGALVQAIFGDRVLWLRGRTGEPLPEEVGRAAGEGILISFLCPWVIPASVIAHTPLALNFHPGSSRYPGTGCYNFALYEGAESYGAVCHHIAPQVDSGAIVLERLFPVFPEDTIETLKLRTMVVMLGMFHEVLGCLRRGDALPRSEAAWTRPAFRRRELDALCRLTPDMSPDEIARRVRATTYPGFPGAVMEVGGFSFPAPVPARPPLA